MFHLAERALYYTFLLQKVMQSGGDIWDFAAQCFGVNQNMIKQIKKIIKNDIFIQLITVGDIQMYLNFLNTFGNDGGQFGKSKTEQMVIDIKLTAYTKLKNLFGEERALGNALYELSQNYAKDSSAAVLYALGIMYSASGKSAPNAAVEILQTELYSNRNSDAGLILLELLPKKAENIIACLKGAPDMLLHADFLSELAKKYHVKDIDADIGKRQPIGFLR